MNPSLTFGNIFFYESAEHVFLGYDGTDLFATKVLDIELSNEIRSRFKSIIAKNDEGKRRLLLYQFNLSSTHFSRQLS